ncbi:MAG: hypothetical protein UR26_C0007G0009 [candidate division TM6 bacterium GW2011_GWF2_32_72]|nr:MAG: hypothetical protein UR26_C0007G0009 [candidate division TM6 bacterium GW2011_GWF2_32_72]
MKPQKTLCIYFQAKIKREKCWMLTAILRGMEHVAFDRTIDKETSTFEFFVPEATKDIFLNIMERLKKEGVVLELQELPNRLAEPDSVL